MANPLRVGESVAFGSGMLLKRPELAALIGCACADWAYVETLISMFYGHLMGVYLPKHPGFEPPTHPVALQIFDELQSIHAKVNLVKKLAAWVIKDEAQGNDASSVLERLRKAGDGRNKVAHGVWGVCDSEPDALILLPTFGDRMIYKKQDFELILVNIQKAMTELGRIHNDFYQQRRGIAP
ncbi:hypothetical protein LP417_25075 [Polaromonas sp. P1-6]|nr:hypothetical protein LP417_25075 [Polaromonas sp. P1-6]